MSTKPLALPDDFFADAMIRKLFIFDIPLDY